jgi:ATP-dependent DNA helicase RecQ
MTKYFSLIKQIIETGDNSFNPNEITENCQQRFLKALAAINTPYTPSPQDITCLIRHLLRREDEDLQGGSQQTLKIPRIFPYPLSKEIWQQCGINILGETLDYFLISAHSWQPEWLKLSDQYVPDQPIYAEINRRNYQSVTGDPFLQLVNLNNYRSIGQKEAIRAVLTAPKNSTLVVNLPTGSGKSLVAQLPTLLNSQNSGVSVMIVPTTALAIDQERALKPFISYPLAYYSDNSEAGKERRKSIRQRIREGKQTLIITSPESLIDSLTPALYQAAKQNYLRYFIIDEAHIIEQWGDNFRPAFQQIPSLHQDLLRYTSFQTILLTATLTQSCLNTLETLFKSTNEFQVISAVQLRPEPSFWFSYCQNEAVRKKRLLEAIYYLPRPLIIYATKREDVYNLAKFLKEKGFKRYGIMTGDSTTTEREELIKNWREQNIDLVIATSAFGLGVDQGDVRAVIHVCIPETIDRFYQEVGRGGRDGKAAISLTLYTADDYRIAQSLNQKTTITLERGLERWHSIFQAKQPLSDGKFRINIDLAPTFKDKDIDMDSKQNQAWNLRTLLLMSQANLIKIEWEQPPRNINYKSEKDYQIAYQNYNQTRIISIINEHHLDVNTWELEVEPIRQQRQQFNGENLKLMKEALSHKPTRCLSEIFAEAYYIPAREKPSPRKSVNVSLACGGCPFCRSNNRLPFANIMPSPLPIWQQPDFYLKSDLARILDNCKLMLIFYKIVEQKEDKKGIILINWLIEQGVKNIVAHPKVYSIFQKKVDQPIFLFDEYQPLKMPNLPTLILSLPEDQITQKHLKVSPNQAPKIIILPITTPDPNREDRQLINMFNGRSFTLEEFCIEVGI